MAIEIVGATELLIYASLMILGAILAVVVPYILNKWNDKETTVNWYYVVTLIFGCIMAVFLGMPSKVDVISIDTIKTALLAGYGMQAIVSKLVKSYLENQKPEGTA